MLYQIKYNSKIARNVIKTFKEIHARKVCHRDVQFENVLVKLNDSIVMIDFELNKMNIDSNSLRAEIKTMKYLLTSLKLREDVAL